MVKRTSIAGIFLWSLSIILILAIILSLITTVSYTDETHAETDGDIFDDIENMEDLEDIEDIELEEMDDEKATINTEYVNLNIKENYTIDLFVNSYKTNVFIENLNPLSETGVIGIESSSIDSDMNSTANVGLCAVGLNSDESITKFTVDESNNTITADINQENQTEVEYKNSQDILDDCTT